MKISLTRDQLRSPEGSELIDLVEAAVANGKLNDAAIERLRAWITANREVPIVAIRFLDTILQPEMSSDQRHIFHLSLEKILPPERRAAAQAIRKAAEAIEEANASADALAKLRASVDAAKERRIKSRPVLSLNFMIAGAKYENRPEIVRRFLSVGDTVYLAREPDNPHDANATAVRMANGMNIGYVPRDDAVEVSKLLASGHRQHVFCSTILKAHYGPLPVIAGALYLADAPVADAITESDIPQKTVGLEEISAPVMADGKPARAPTPILTSLYAFFFIIGILWLILSALRMN